MSRVATQPGWARRIRRALVTSLPGTCSRAWRLLGGEGPAPALKALELIQKAMKLVPPAELKALFAHHGLRLRREREVPQKYGKRFWFGTFGR